MRLPAPSHLIRRIPGAPLSPATTKSLTLVSVALTSAYLAASRDSVLSQVVTGGAIATVPLAGVSALIGAAALRKAKVTLAASGLDAATHSATLAAAQTRVFAPALRTVGIAGTAWVGICVGNQIYVKGQEGHGRYTNEAPVTEPAKGRTK